MPDCDCCSPSEAARLERNTLWMLLVINGVMFVVEAGAGWWGESSGLVADSLDMLADAFVYAISLYAVGRSPGMQTGAARASGVLQMLLGLGVLVDVARRFVYGSEPVSLLMITIGTVALAANISCLLLLSKHRQGGVHMRASWIFSTNDVIANLGVILSGALVMVLGTRLPDLVIGAVIAFIVVRGGVRILGEAKAVGQGG
ncbi:cation transporter [Desulfosudis oleivorans]|uniref:Cation efflux protein n=1 Tax=Desulfosudis oleivorans (strain DSM 6200 / JCM 39069 / Hxd3) TaxID=96561 RepID=A8ZUB3_DESOH|nr:cation transporter [Desulfosudis oleivorans]ABW67945.1 cation efflux protein [Desulfosudis oleivorans Hxd3]